MHDRVLLAESWPAGEVFRLPGGYVDDGGVVHREVELVPLTGADEERLAGLNAPAVAVITQLLARVVRRIGTLPQPGPGVMRSLLVGDRDFLVVKLRQLTLGDEVDIDLSCANAECGKRMDLSFVLTNMPVEERPVDSRFFELQTDDGGEVVFRLPTGGDQEALAAWAADGDGVRRLLARLIQRIGPLQCPGPEVVASLPESVCAQIEERMRRLSPEVSAEIEGVCPECGSPFSRQLDLPYLLLTELIGTLRALEREVHVLAFHYHWSEGEILSMTREKRRRYVGFLESQLELAQEV